METLFKITAIILTIIGIILDAKALKILELSEKEDQILLRKKDLSDEDFNKMLDEHVFNPKKRANKLAILAMILYMPLLASYLNINSPFIKIVSVIGLATYIILIVKTAKRC